MPLDLARFAAVRPYLYHLTDAANIVHLRQTRRLEPASVLLEQVGQSDTARRRRDGDLPVTMPDGHSVVICNQAPFRAGSIHLEGGWTIEDVLADLNRRVFFWPGREAGPVPYGRRHFEAHTSKPCSVLVVPTRAIDLSAAEFSVCNSGSPRCSPGSRHLGRKAPRGPRTFLPAHQFVGTAGDIVEVTFRGGVDLPWDLVQVVTPSSFSREAHHDCRTRLPPHRRRGGVQRLLLAGSS